MSEWDGRCDWLQTTAEHDVVWSIHNELSCAHFNGEWQFHAKSHELIGAFLACPPDFTQTRGHKYKLYRHQSNVNTYKQFFCNCICDTWNALPHTVVEAPSLNTFKRLLNNVAVCHVAVLPSILHVSFVYFFVLLWAYVSGHLALCVLWGLFSLNCELSWVDWAQGPPLLRDERSLPLPGCRTIVPVLQILLSRLSMLPSFQLLSANSLNSLRAPYCFDR